MTRAMTWLERCVSRRSRLKQRLKVCKELAQSASSAHVPVHRTQIRHGTGWHAARRPHAWHRSAALVARCNTLRAPLAWMQDSQSPNTCRSRTKAGVQPTVACCLLERRHGRSFVQQLRLTASAKHTPQRGQVCGIPPKKHVGSTRPKQQTHCGHDVQVKAGPHPPGNQAVLPPAACTHPRGDPRMCVVGPPPHNRPARP